MGLGAGHARGIQPGGNTVAADRNRQPVLRAKFGQRAGERLGGLHGPITLPVLVGVIGDLDLLVVKPMLVVEEHVAAGVARLVPVTAWAPLGRIKLIGRERRNPRAGRQHDPPLGQVSTNNLCLPRTFASRPPGPPGRSARASATNRHRPALAWSSLKNKTLSPKTVGESQNGCKRCHFCDIRPGRLVGEGKPRGNADQCEGEGQDYDELLHEESCLPIRIEWTASI